MTRKTKLILFISLSVLLGLASFLIFRQKASAPHTISIQNSNDDVDGTAAGPLYSGPAAPDSDTENPPENIAKNTEPTKETTKDETKEKATDDLPVTSYELQVTRNLVSWGFSSASGRKIDTVIIHSSYNALSGNEYDVEKLIQEYKEYEVAPHYLIDRQGKIYQLVADKNIAYHAGESKVPDGRTGVNTFSLGIEMMNTKEDKYTDDQYTALNSLLSTLKSRYSIKYTLGHNDVSPGRKTDPWNFDWKKIN